ncbi:MAG TPA: RNA methyltransferase [Candidatus Intestinimonas stercoravium]|nr:RNA methyltransferase [Candidatus Intestinimonas stercoravium]
MARIIEIDDITAPGLEPYAQLTHAQLRRRREPGEGILIAESAKVISCALDAGCRPISLLMERRHIPAFEAHMADWCGDVPVYTADREVLAGLTGYALTRGMLCAMRRPALPQVEALCRSSRRVVVLENVTDASNVGALFRSAAALGMDAVLVAPSCCDPFYRRAVRVSMGTVFQIPWTWIGEGAGQWPRAALSHLRELGYKTVAMALREDSIGIDDPALAGEERLAILLGSEGSGLSEAAIEASDYTARIPMAHGVDSLNVAAAGAVVFWQLRPRPYG